MTAPNVIGLDLSLTSTGVAAERGEQTINVKTKGMQRLRDIRRELRMAYGWGDIHADLVVVEHYAFGRPNQASFLGELGGCIRLDLHELHIPYLDVAPTVLKKYATGKGNAGKEEVMVAAIHRLGYGGYSNDEADALWLRAIGCDLLGAPLVSLPELHRVALKKLELPKGVAA